MVNAVYSKEEFKKQPAEFRIGAIISDGMWYSLPKWKKLAKVDEETIGQWIEEKLASGELIQSKDGKKSYRFSHNAIKKWYLENDEQLGRQLVEFLFPPRIWDGLTETEGFINAPRREVGIVNFSCAPHVASEIIKNLKGIAKVREVTPGSYKSYSLDISVVKLIIAEVFSKYQDNDKDKVYSRAASKRRELVDFSPEFSQGLVMFYKNFGKSLVKRTMETISIFIPDPEEQETQIIIWVIDAIEKYDELEPVPFSGYLDTVLKYWPYDLPNTHLGKGLSNFQKERSRALKTLKKRTGRSEFTTDELSGEMGVGRGEFMALEEKHKVWISVKSATTLTWDENSEEKKGEGSITELHRPGVASPTDIALANRLSYAVIQTALETESWEDAFNLITQIDATDINISKIREVSEEFIQTLGSEMGIGEQGY